MTVQLRNVIQCPVCGFKITEQMPREKKTMSYHCPACSLTSTAHEQECCIFCKFGRLPCPVQQANSSQHGNSLENRPEES